LYRSNARTNGYNIRGLRVRSIKLLRLGSIGHFLSKAPEPPPLDAVIEAEALLRELGCLDAAAADALTPLGAILAKLPIGKLLSISVSLSK
jgi:HrpA-like RNA helicase